MCYNNGSTCVNCIEFNDIKVPAEQITYHLGNLVGPAAKDSDIVSITNDFIKTVNFMLSIFGKCDSKVKFKLLKQTVCHYMVQICGITPVIKWTIL